jgi:hypothetical protein
MIFKIKVSTARTVLTSDIDTMLPRPLSHFFRIPALGRLAAISLFAASGLTAALDVTPASAKVFYAREQMFDLAFPEADDVEAVDFFLTAEQRERIESLASSEIERDFMTIYVGRRDGNVIGYALLDTHLVRTLPETFLIVLGPDGAVASTYVMAFHEPLEYMPHERWLALLHDRELDEELRIGRGIVGLTGSTLSAHAVLGSVRRAMAAHRVLIEDAVAEAAAE